MNDRTFVGFGFGAIQGGLFLFEAFYSRNFKRLVVAEVMAEVVDAVRKGGGRYRVNVATPKGIEPHEISGVEIYNPRVAGDRKALEEAVAEASEIATALPSVKFFGEGRDGDVVDILSAGLERKLADAKLPPAVIYTGENHNHAAEVLDGLLAKRMGQGPGGRFQTLNTVIGKMSGVVTDSKQIAEQNLALVTDSANRAFLVEAFNRIFITKIALPGFNRGVEVFEEKPDLFPFEEAKLYGHNATHALIGYLLRVRRAGFMAEARRDATLMALARGAFLEESGGALCRKYAGLDALFTTTGYAAYVDDLLERMMNPYLKDTVDRITRDARRKLSWDDRLVGTMRVVLGQGLEPTRYTAGAAAALRCLQEEEKRTDDGLLDDVWKDAKATPAEKAEIKRRILVAKV